MGKEKELLQIVQKRIMEDMDFAEELSDEQLKELISRHLLEREKNYQFTLLQRKQLGKEIFDSLRKLDVLQDLLDDDDVTEIMVNGPETIFAEKRYLCFVLLFLKCHREFWLKSSSLKDSKDHRQDHRT